MRCCSFDATVDQEFNDRRAAKELRRFRRRGAGATARMLLRGLTKGGLSRGTLLDVGAGVGALTWTLIDSGVTSAVIVEASRAYLSAAEAEGHRRGQLRQAQLIHGDFLDVANRVPPVTVVTLDRVICYYPAYAGLLETALARAERLFAFSYPRDRWYVRTAVHVENLMRRRRSGFRTFVHREAAMRRLIENAGFELVSHAQTLAWCGDVFVRRA